MSKYFSKRCGKYASKKEANRAIELKILAQRGEIHDLEEQVRFQLIPSQRDISGRVIERPCYYVADFVYINDAGKKVVEDTKGFKTPDYIIKRKLMLHVHGIRILEK